MLLRLKPVLRPFLWLIVGSFLLAFPLAALRVIPAPFLKYLVDDLLVSRDESRLMLFPLLFVGLYVLNFAVRFGHYYLLRVVVVRVNQALKNRLYDHLLSLSADYYTAQSTGNLISRVGSDPALIDGGISMLNVIVREPITFLMLFGYALTLNWKLTLITLAILPPLAWVFAATGRNLKRYINRMAEENASIFSTLQETFTGIRVVKTFGLEKHLGKRFQDQSETYARFHLKTAVVEEASHPLVELLTSFVLAAMIYVGGGEVLRGSMTPGELIAFFATFALMMHPLRLMNDVNIKLNTASAAAGRIFELLDWKSRVTEPTDARSLPAFKSELELKDVRFAYPDTPQRDVLKGVSFRVSRGKTVALVGPSGGGKSSLVSLLPRIFDVTGGSVKVDGVDVREVRLEDLRKLIAVVSQDVFLFNDTIEENIRLGRTDATAEEIREAAKRAHALEFIERMPQGFRSRIGDRGQKLSGGERQRISIARAFLRESPILILDEATSSLDTASEKAVQSALNELMKDRTTVVIAHRLSTIRDADEILVLREGEVVERGTHTQLMEKNGEFARLSRLTEAPAP